MSWRDKLQSASFRGIPFKVATHDHGVGRRNIVHQFPGADKPYIEDLGPDADTFTIEGYVLQNIGNGFDYFRERDALIAALRQEGPGTLIHPFFGEKRVSLIGQARVAENLTADTGIARFTMSFVQYGEKQVPEIEIDQVAAVDNAVSDAVGKMKDQFYEAYHHSSISESSFVEAFTSATSMSKKAILSVRDAVGAKVGAVINAINEEIEQINTIVGAGCAVATSAVNSVSAFLDATGVTTPIVKGITGHCSGALRGEVDRLEGDVIPNLLGVSMVKALEELTRFGESPDTENPSIYGGQLAAVTINDYESAVKAANQHALVDLVRSAAIANAVKVASRTVFQSYDECQETVAEIVSVIDSVLTDMADNASDTSYAENGVAYRNDDQYSAIEALRGQFIKSMTVIGASYAKIRYYVVPPVAITSLELAYDLYEDIDRADEIHGRNRRIVSHPGLLPGGRELEILSA